MFNNVNWYFVIGAAIGSFLSSILYCLWFWSPRNVEKRKAKMLKKIKEDQAAYESSFTKWLDDNWDDDNMLPPALNADDAIVFLKHYLLGPGWYVNYPGSSGQITTEITCEILKKYSKRFRKECKKNDFRWNI